MADDANRGVMVGICDANSFVGRFTNADRTGWFDLSFLSRTGSFRSGQSGWVGEGSSGSWDLSKTNGSGSRPENVSCN